MNKPKNKSLYGVAIHKLVSRNEALVELPAALTIILDANERKKFGAEAQYWPYAADALRALGTLEYLVREERDHFEKLYQQQPRSSARSSPSSVGEESNATTTTTNTTTSGAKKSKYPSLHAAICQLEVVAEKLNTDLNALVEILVYEKKRYLEHHAPDSLNNTFIELMHFDYEFRGLFQTITAEADAASAFILSMQAKQKQYLASFVPDYITTNYYESKLQPMMRKLKGLALLGHLSLVAFKPKTSSENGSISSSSSLNNNDNDNDNDIVSKSNAMDITINPFFVGFDFESHIPILRQTLNITDFIFEIGTQFVPRLRTFLSLVVKATASMNSAHTYNEQVRLFAFGLANAYYFIDRRGAAVKTTSMFSNLDVKSGKALWDILDHPMIKAFSYLTLPKVEISSSFEIPLNNNNADQQEAAAAAAADNNDNDNDNDNNYYNYYEAGDDEEEISTVISKAEADVNAASTNTLFQLGEEGQISAEDFVRKFKAVPPLPSSFTRNTAQLRIISTRKIENIETLLNLHLHRDNREFTLIRNFRSAIDKSTTNIGDAWNKIWTKGADTITTSINSFSNFTISGGNKQPQRKQSAEATKELQHARTMYRSQEFEQPTIDNIELETFESSSSASTTTTTTTTTTSHKQQHQADNTTSNTSNNKQQYDGCIIMHIHGGGFIAMSPFSHENYLRLWANDLNIPIVSVNYSKAPDYKFPIALEECFTAYKYLLENAHNILGVPLNRIVLVGDSAGGNLCTAVVLRAIAEGIRVPDAVALIYPAINLANVASPARILTLIDPLVNYGFLKVCAESYISPAFEKFMSTNPYISPSAAPDYLLASFPPTYVTLGSLDPLFDDGVLMARRICKNNGGRVKLEIFDGLGHGYLNLVDYVPEAKQAVDKVSEWIKEALASSFSSPSAPATTTTTTGASSTASSSITQ